MGRALVPSHLSFREFLKWRMDELHVEVSEFKEKSGPYLRNILSGVNSVQKDSTLQELYDWLRIRQLGVSYDMDWFRIYARLDYQPFTKYQLRKVLSQDPRIERLVLKLVQLNERSLGLVEGFLDLAASEEE